MIPLFIMKSLEERLASPNTFVTTPLAFTCSSGNEIFFVISYMFKENSNGFSFACKIPAENSNKK